MMQSMYSGVAGLDSQQTAMDVIGNNIANVSTVGFKASNAVFEEALSQTYEGATAPTAAAGGTDPLQVGLGVQVGDISVDETQGSMTATGNNTDLAISGGGYFVLGTGANQLYTRAGSFGLNSQTQLVNPANGMYVQGWQAGAGGVINTNTPLGNIQIPLGNTIVANPTGNASLQGNLQSSSAVGTQVTSAVAVYDSLGNSNTITVTFAKTASNTWSWTASGPGVTVGGTGVNQGVVTFNTEGALAGSTGALDINNAATGAASPQAVAMDFADMTQFGSANTVSTASQDGYAAGTLNNFTIGQDGTITGTYSNGVAQTIGQVALASFSNANGLQATSDSMYQVTANSGTAQIGVAGQGGRGAIDAGNLEASNVNLADQFTSMITTERAYEANSKIITVADQMLQDLNSLVR